MATKAIADYARGSSEPLLSQFLFGQGWAFKPNVPAPLALKPAKLTRLPSLANAARFLSLALRALRQLTTIGLPRQSFTVYDGRAFVAHLNELNDEFRCKIPPVTGTFAGLA